MSALEQRPEVAPRLPRPDLSPAVRITPVPFPGSRARHLVERNVMNYRRHWMVIVSGFFEPFFYLLGMGFGLGAIVGPVAGPGGTLIPYAVFVAPALMASSAMNGAIYDSTMNIYFKLRYSKIYDSILSTPLGAADVAIGELTWALIRGTLYASSFLVIMAILGLVQSPWALLAIPGAMLIGFAFGAVGMAATTYARSWADFDLITLATMPLFLFSATFYPLDSYPEALRIIVQLTPLYHGVDLLRALTTGNLEPYLLVHVAYLVAMGILGLAISRRRFARILLR